MILYINGKRVAVKTTFGENLALHMLGGDTPTPPTPTEKSTVTLIVENWDSSTDTIEYSVEGGTPVVISTLSFQIDTDSEVEITVKKSGYFDWTQTFVVDEETLEITPELEEIHTIDDSVLSDYNYEMVGNVARLTSYNGSSTTVVIPNV